MKEPATLCEVWAYNVSLPKPEFDELCDEMASTKYFGCDYRSYSNDLDTSNVLYPRWVASVPFGDADKSGLDMAFDFVTDFVTRYLEKINKPNRSVLVKKVYYDDV